MRPAPFTYSRAHTIEEALSMLREGGTPLAGGQSLVPLMKLRLARPLRIVDLNPIAELQGIEEETDGSISIGAMVTHRQVELSTLILDRLPWLAAAAAAIADVQVRNKGTIGGSICMADTKANLPPVLISLGAEAEIRKPERQRVLPIEEVSVGFMQNSLAPDELLVRVRIPAWPRGTTGRYREIAVPKNELPLLATAVTVFGSPVERVGVGVGGFSTQPIRATAIEQALLGKALTPEHIVAATAQLDGDAAMEDMHADRRYRHAVAKVLVKRSLMDCAADQGR